MEKNVLTPQRKRKPPEKQSFSPYPRIPLSPICTNLFFKENITNNVSISPSSQKIRVKTKLQWTEEENNNIREFVKKFGTKNWKKLSEICPGKTPKQLREHYFNCLETNIIKKKDFTPNEDEMILSFVQNNGRKFAQLSKLMPGRTETSIKNRFYFLIKKNLHCGLRFDLKYEPENNVENNLNSVTTQTYKLNDEINDNFNGDNQNLVTTNDIKEIFLDDQTLLFSNQIKENFIDDSINFLDENQTKDIFVDQPNLIEDEKLDSQMTFNFNTEWINQPY